MKRRWREPPSSFGARSFLKRHLKIGRLFGKSASQAVIHSFAGDGFQALLWCSMRIVLELEPYSGALALPIHYNYQLQAMIYRSLDEALAEWLHNRGYSVCTHG